MQLEHVIRFPGFACGAYGPLAISVWDCPATPEHARAGANLLAAVGRSEDEMVLMAILGRNAPPPEGAVREILSAEIKRLGPKVIAAANVIEGEGFRAAALRGALTGMVLIIRPKHAQKACATVAEGASFLRQYAPAITESGVIRAVAALRGGEFGAMDLDK